ncbi:MAG: c-type cytochrome [Woeseiaceae bacterium]
MTRHHVAVFIICFFSFTVQADEFIGGNFMLKALLDEPKRYCLDLEGYASTTDTTAPPIVHSCKEGWWRDGTYKVDYPQPGHIYLPDYDLCLEVVRLEPGTPLKLNTCSDHQLQRFIFRDDQKVEITSDSADKLCLAIGDESRRTGANLRRETLMVSCDEADEKTTQWILPREGAEYPAIDHEPAVAADRPAGARRGPRAGRPVNLYVGACSPCHGASGEGYAGEHSPKISGQEDWYLARQLANFANDIRGAHDSERWAKQMNFHVKDFTQTQLDSFVNYVGTLEDVPAETSIEADSSRGAELYVQFCLTCHAANGMGNQELNSPRLAGMTDWYMVTQMQKFRTGLRGAHPDDTYGIQMAPFAKALPDNQAVLDVVAYINTLSTE